MCSPNITEADVCRLSIAALRCRRHVEIIGLMNVKIRNNITSLDINKRRDHTSYMVVPASLLVIVTSYRHQSILSIL